MRVLKFIGIVSSGLILEYLIIAFCAWSFNLFSVFEAMEPLDRLFIVVLSNLFLAFYALMFSAVVDSYE